MELKLAENIDAVWILIFIFGILTIITFFVSIFTHYFMRKKNKILSEKLKELSEKTSVSREQTKSWYDSGSVNKKSYLNDVIDQNFGNNKTPTIDESIKILDKDVVKENVEDDLTKETAIEFQDTINAIYEQENKEDFNKVKLDEKLLNDDKDVFDEILDDISKDIVVSNDYANSNDFVNNEKKENEPLDSKKESKPKKETKTKTESKSSKPNKENEKSKKVAEPNKKSANSKDAPKRKKNYTKKELDSLTMPELRVILKKNKVPFSAPMTKFELMELVLKNKLKK